MVRQGLSSRCLLVASAVALLVAVISSPLRPTGLSHRASCSSFLRRNFAIPPTYSDRLSAKPAPSRIFTIKALPTESEKERESTSVPAYGSPYLPSLTSFGHADRDRAIPIHAPVACPLRC